MFVRTLAGYIADVVLPQHCAICDSPSDQWLCDGCRQSFEAIVAEPSCAICAAPLVSDGSPCPRCLGRPGRLIRRAAALGRHDGALRELIHHLKYHHRWNLAARLAQYLKERPHAHDLIASADIIVPIPLHWRRRLHRGYNQSQLIAEAIAHAHAAVVCHALVRHRGTRQQTSLKSVSARVRNVRGVFAPTRHAPKLAGRRVLLIDDVLTTQATLRAAARALQPIEPASIDALVLAVADPSNRNFTTI